jgi:hypothetical protein
VSDGFTLKDATGRTFRFEPAPFDIEVVDVWPPGTLTDAAKDAYDALAASGRIIPRGSVTRDAAGRVIVRYMADIPEQWIRQELKEAKMNGRQMRIE